MITQEMLFKAGEESVKFIDNMLPNELGIYTLRKAFEMGYIRGLSDQVELKKETDEI